MEKKECFDLLKSWCDGLIRYQIHDTGDSRFDGGFFCPACKMIHGRSQDAVYPLMCMADFTGEEKYRKAAENVFHWGANMVCDNGSFYNDPQSEWNGITVFGVISLCEALILHGHLLAPEIKKLWEQRMEAAAQWIAKTITAKYKTNINYHASAAAALSLAGKYGNRPEYLVQAKELADFCEKHLLENGLFYGEGQPAEHVTKRGCRPVDIGYNAEESIPSLILYANTVGDSKLTEKLKGILRKLLVFMLPDGAWDNSFGTRNYKWTYWGSRTSDGCQSAYGIWGDTEPVFHEAAVRNLMLYKKCTGKGLLYGGPDYEIHGEEPCIHHTFCHAKALASMIDSGQWSSQPAELPSQHAPSLLYFSEIDTWKISKGGFLGTVTGYDFHYMKGGHASGGTLTMLWHRTAGPVIMSSMTDYWLKEPHNMQLSLKKSQHCNLTPRIELESQGKKYSSCYDYDSRITAEELENEIRIEAHMELKDADHSSAFNPVFCRLVYLFSDGQITIDGSIKLLQKPDSRQPLFIIPVIGRHKLGVQRVQDGWVLPRENGTVKIGISTLDCGKAPDPVFFLAGGFEAWQFTVQPDGKGEFHVSIKVEEEKVC